MNLLDELNAILKEAKEVLPTSKSEADLDTNKNLFVGKKGKLTGVMKGLGALSPEEKKTIGARANEVSKEVEELVVSLKQKIKLDFYENELKNEQFDVLRPLADKEIGSLHPLSRIQYEVEDKLRLTTITSKHLILQPITPRAICRIPSTLRMEIYFAPTLRRFKSVPYAI